MKLKDSPSLEGIFCSLRMVSMVDFAIKIVEGELELTLNEWNAPRLHVSREYTNMLQRV
jgi:hypothetical protein